MITKAVRIYKASRTVDPVPGVIIEIVEAIPDPHPTEHTDELLRECERIYDTQATALANALMGSLPGGTLDRLIAILLQRKASFFRVPWPPIGDPTPE